MTESDIQDAIAVLYDSTADTPASTDDDYLVRRSLMNRALHAWENDNAIEWTDLWTNLTAAADGDKTIVDGDSTYACPTNFKKAGGFIKLYDTNGNLAQRYKVVSPAEAQNKGEDDVYAYFTGSAKDGYTLNLNPAPDSAIAGFTIKYDYYKKVTEYTDTTVTSEIPDPEFIINSVVAQLYKTDQNIAAYTSSLEDAQESLKGMEAKEVAAAIYDQNNVEDLTDGFGIGSYGVN